MPLRKIPSLHAHSFGAYDDDDDENQLNVYRGPVYNHVGGGFWGDLLRKILPVFTGSVLPFVGKQLQQTSEDITNEVASGASLGSALKRGTKRGLQRSKDEILRKLSGGGAYKKRKLSKKSQSKRKRRAVDYFG